MNSEVMKTCADMIITAAIQDKAKRENRSIDSVRSELICSDAFEALYDFDTGLWQEGPDYFLSYYERLENNNSKSRFEKDSMGEEILNSDTIKAFEECDAIKDHPEEYKRYDSFSVALKDLNNGKV